MGNLITEGHPMKKLLRFAIFGQVFLSLATHSGRLAQAQPKPVDDYDTLIERASAAAEKNRFEEALEAYIPAYKIEQDYRVACSIARFSLRVEKRRLIDAAKFYEICRRTAPRPKTQAGIERRAAELAELEVAKAHIITVTVHADEGASIFSNGEFAGVAPLKFALFLEPGQSVIEARKGDQSITQTVKGERGDALSVQLVNKPIPNTPSPAPTVPIPSALPTFKAASTEPPSTVFQANTRSGWDRARQITGLAAFIAFVPAFSVGTYTQVNAINADEEKTHFITQAALAKLKGNTARHEWTLAAAKKADRERVAQQNIATGLFVMSGVFFATGIACFAIGGVQISPNFAGLEGSYLW